MTRRCPAAIAAALVFALSSCGLLPKPESDAASFVPHVLDSAQTAAVISNGGIEMNPVGWPPGKPEGDRP